MPHDLGWAGQSFRGTLGRLNALNPLAILERGYSVTFNEKGDIIKDIRQLAVGEMMNTCFGQGSAVSKVVSLQENHEEK